VQNLRIRGTISSTPLYVSVAWCVIELKEIYFFFFFFFFFVFVSVRLTACFLEKRKWQPAREADNLIAICEQIV
jgi:hypothetical protein